MDTLVLKYWNLKENIFKEYYSRNNSFEYYDNYVIVKSNKYIIKSEYEILGIVIDNKWIWSHDLNFIEKKLTNKSKIISNKLNDYSILDIIKYNDDIFIKYLLYYSNDNWIIKNKINDKNTEYILIKRILNITYNINHPK